MVSGRRTEEKTKELIEDFASRVNDGRPPVLITADEYGPYSKYLLEIYGDEVVPERTSNAGRPKKPYKVAPPDLLFATVHKNRQGGKVVDVNIRLVFGTEEGLKQALENSEISKAVNTAFIERYNGTDRHFNARKARETYEFSKDNGAHVDQSWLSISYYNFCWDHKSLRIRNDSDGLYQHRSPAMAARITDHIWSMEELVTYQVKKVNSS